jgi:hypothetical protein
MQVVTSMPGTTWKFARIHHELLNDPADLRGQNLRLAFGLDHVLGEARRRFFVELSNVESARSQAPAVFAAITIGAWIGLLIMVVVRRAHERKFIASYK